MNPLQRFIRSLRHAGRGLYQTLANENNFRIHFAVAVVVIIVLVWLRVSAWESAMLIFLIGIILTLELLNTAVERFVDLLEPRIHPYAGVIKDTLAAAILIMSFSASLIGIMILWPYIVSAYRWIT